jgi:hypothetical protein
MYMNKYLKYKEKYLILKHLTYILQQGGTNTSIVIPNMTSTDTSTETTDTDIETTDTDTKTTDMTIDQINEYITKNLTEQSTKLNTKNSVIDEYNLDELDKFTDLLKQPKTEEEILTDLAFHKKHNDWVFTYKLKNVLENDEVIDKLYTEYNMLCSNSKYKKYCKFHDKREMLKIIQSKKRLKQKKRRLRKLDDEDIKTAEELIINILERIHVFHIREKDVSKKKGEKNEDLGGKIISKILETLNSSLENKLVLMTNINMFHRNKENKGLCEIKAEYTKNLKGKKLEFDIIIAQIRPDNTLQYITSFDVKSSVGAVSSDLNKYKNGLEFIRTCLSGSDRTTLHTDDDDELYIDATFFGSQVPVSRYLIMSDMNNLIKYSNEALFKIYRNYYRMKGNLKDMHTTFLKEWDFKEYDNTLEKSEDIFIINPSD